MKKQWNLSAALLLSFGGCMLNAQAATLDFNGDQRDDMLWHDPQTQQYYMYHMQADGQRTTVRMPHSFDDDWKVAGRGDFDGDHKSELWLRNLVTGQNYIVQPESDEQSQQFVNTVPLVWKMVGVADLNGDGRDDVLWRHQQTGAFWLYQMNGAVIDSSVNAGQIELSWRLLTLGDVNGDGKADRIFQHRFTGDLYVHEMNGNKTLQQYPIGQRDSHWSFAGSGDFDGDGHVDLLWRHLLQGDTVIDFMAPGHIQRSERINRLNNFEWYVATVGDFNADNKADIYWYNAQYGLSYVYQMDGAQVTGFMAPQIIADRYLPVQPLLQPVVFSPAFAVCLGDSMAQQGVSQLADLTQIRCDNRNLSYLQLGDAFTSLQSLSVEHNQLKNLPVQGSDTLQQLDMSFNQVTDVRFEQDTWHALNRVDLRFNPLSYAMQWRHQPLADGVVELHQFHSERFTQCAYGYLQKHYQVDKLNCNMESERISAQDLVVFPASALLKLDFKVDDLYELESVRQQLADIVQTLGMTRYDIQFSLPVLCHDDCRIW